MKTQTATWPISTTTWSEDRVLDYFWTVARDAHVDRLELLGQIAAVRLARPSEWDEKAIRIAMGGVTRRKFRGSVVTLAGERCFACRTEARRVYWHHVIQVQHGGSNTPRNLVSLCHRCHRDVHPWLPAGTTIENRGFTWLRDIAQRALDRLTKVWGARIEEHKTRIPPDDQPF